jgi:hypothetical protein
MKKEQGMSLSNTVGADELKLLREHYLGATLLKVYKESPRNFLYQFFNKTAPTPNLVFGSYYHTCILEPSELKNRYEVIDYNERPEPEKTMASNKNKEWIAGKLLTEKTIISKEDAETARAMQEVLMNNPTAHKLLTGGYSEKEFYIDDFNGVRTRAKPDKVKGTIMVDLKTTEDASPNAFPYMSAKFGYHIQMAYYYDQLRYLNIPIEIVVIVAQEKTPPYSPAIYLCTDQMLAVGQMEYTALLEMHKKCLETGYFPGYEVYADDPNNMFDLSIPNYKIQEPKINFQLWKQK